MSEARLSDGTITDSIRRIGPTNCIPFLVGFYRSWSMELHREVPVHGDTAPGKNGAWHRRYAGADRRVAEDRSLLSLAEPPPCPWAPQLQNWHMAGSETWLEAKVYRSDLVFDLDARLLVGHSHRVWRDILPGDKAMANQIISLGRILACWGE
jgi:hypothetical protein